MFTTLQQMGPLLPMINENSMKRCHLGPIKGGHSQKSHYYTTDQLPNSNVMFIREKTESCLSVQSHTLQVTKTLQVIYKIISRHFEDKRLCDMHMPNPVPAHLAKLNSKTDLFMHDRKEVESDATHINFTSIDYSQLLTISTHPIIHTLW